MNISDTIKAIVLLGMSGKRLLAKYCDDKLDSRQLDKKLFSQTKCFKPGREEVLIVEDLVVLHKRVADFNLYIVGGKNENPLILDRVLRCLVEVFTTMLNGDVQKNSLIDIMDQVVLALDEVCDEGVVLETDPDLVLQRICLKDGVAEQSMAQVLHSATGHLGFSWIRS